MLDELESGLAESAKSLVLNIRKILQSYFEQILKIEPYRILADRKILLNNVSSRINERIGRVFTNLKIRFEMQAAKLSACNPKSILNRGYSIAKNTITGKVVTRPADVNIGDLMITELANENIIESKVTKR
jgi:exonuclease VII large subunit